MKIKKKFIFFLFFVQTIYAAEYSMSGSIDNKILNYTSNQSKNFGYYHLLKFEQKAKFNKDFQSINQVKIKAFSIEEDLKNKIDTDKKSSFDTYLGENYFRYQLPSLTTQLGFQEVVWGEAFGFNYADIINPKDNRMTFFSEQGDSRIPILMANLKYFFSFGSLQFIWSPRPQFSKSLPLDLFMANTFTQSHIVVNKEKTPEIGKENDYGGKISTSFKGLDASAFYFDYLDRNAYYSVSSASLTTIELNEKHSRAKSYGLSFAKTLFDFVLRSDFIITKDRTFNYINNSNLLNYKSDAQELLFSFDTPTWEKITGFLIYARKDQQTYLTNSLMPKKTDYIIAKITKSMDNEKSLELSFTRELNEKANGMQLLLNLPVNNNTEIKMGGEVYFGNESSNFSKLKKINNIFFSIKNYFQI